MNYVIGSGPAGVAAATALLNCGQLVTMLDAGGELDASIQSRVDRMAQQEPEEWSRRDRDELRGDLRFNSEAAPLKLAFGSDYVYRDVDRLQPVQADGVDAYRGFAAGGLSVLWGAALLPYASDDFDGWPLAAADLAPYYARALALTGLAAERDALTSRYPLYLEPTTRLEASSQARFIADRMTRHEAELAAQHVLFGRARLAIAKPQAGVRSCAHCGMCLYGCPYGLIYSARMTLQGLAGAPGFTYTPGVVVRRLEERAGTVLVHGVGRATESALRFQASRVYLAGGTLGSTAILAESLGIAQPLRLAQSDHFLVPMWLRGFAASMGDERLHTLSQLFIELLSPATATHGVHLQLYTYNDFYGRMLKERIGPAYAAVRPLANRVIDRIVLLKGYLHSNESAGIEARWERGTLRLTPVANAASAPVVDRVVTLLRDNRQRIGATPLRLGVRRGLPGSGVHVGGSFPMRATPGPLESDALGRPAGLSRVHVVDASVFPTMPAPPPTLTVMANAFRIAEASCTG